MFEVGSFGESSSGQTGNQNIIGKIS